jgi:polysaccharide biosynthesis PFTS motif protein
MTFMFLPQWLHVFLSRNIKYFEAIMFQNFQFMVNQGDLIRLRRIMNEIISFEYSVISAIVSTGDNPGLIQSTKIFRSCNLISTLIFNEHLVRNYTIATVYQKSISYPLPPRYWNFFQNNGIRINKIMSLFLWIVYEFLGSFKQIYSTVRKCLVWNSQQDILPGSCLVIGLNEKVLTKTSEDEKCFEVWLKRNLNFTGNIYGLNLKNIDSFKTEISTVPATNLFDYRPRNFLIAFSEIFKFRFSVGELVLMLRYFHESYKFRFLNKANIQNIEIFITLASESWVKPVWFGQMKLDSSRIIYVNLSASSSPTTLNEIQFFGWERLNQWNEVWVLDAHQKHLFSAHSIQSDFKVIAMGCPFWTDRLEPFIDSKDKGNYVAIFDIQPTRKFLGWSGFYDCGYFDTSSILNFIRDILEVSARLGKICVLKSKRKSPRYFDPEYYQGIEILEKEYKNFIYVDPDIAPQRIIQDSLVTISVPFTSTAIIASELGIPSLFYDPIGKVLRNDPSARGTHVVSGQTELYTKLCDLFSKKLP